FHLAEQLEAHIQEKQRSTQAELRIIRETTLLETGGGLVNALPLLDATTPLFIVNGDILWQDTAEAPALQRLEHSYRMEDMDALLLLIPRDHAIGYEGNGDFNLEDSGHITRHTPPPYPYVFGGVQILHPRTVAHRMAEPFSLSQIFAELLKKQRIFGLPHTGQWLHLTLSDIS
ncbi:MAG: hypothetical protein KDD76_03395, partial [Rickettsiales bacterium]|nr:hypothetical protein [Rickettsiales bacterium]